VNATPSVAIQEVRSTATHHQGSRNFTLWVVVAILWCIGGLNSFNGDQHNYEAFYDRVGQDLGSYGLLSGYVTALGTERFAWGYTLFAIISKSLTLSYQQFFGILFLLSLIIIGVTAQKISAHPLIFIIGYFLYPFYFDVVQIRYAVAQAIVLYSLTYLAKRRTSDIVKFTVCIVLAASFHIACLVFIILLLAMINKPGRILAISCGIAALLSLFLHFAPNINTIFISATDTDESDVGTPIMRLLMFGTMICAIMISAYFLRQKNCSVDTSQSNSVLLCCVYTYVILLTLLLIDAQFYRLLRTGLVISTLVALQKYNTDEARSQEVNHDHGAKALYVIVNLFFIVLLMWRHELTIKPWMWYNQSYVALIWSHNLLFSYFANLLQ
jgi:hypothetical protein